MIECYLLFLLIRLGNQCFCTDELQIVDAQDIAPNECNQVCPGNPKEICGGGYRISVYKKVTPNALGSSNTPASPSTSGTPPSTPTSVKTSVTSSTSAPASTSVPPATNPWFSLGCYTDLVTPNVRVLPTSPSVPGEMTIELCQNACKNGGFTYAGVEFATQCFCGNSIGGGGSKALEAECNKPCAGNSKEICGGGNRINIFTTATLTTKTSVS